MWIFYFKKLCSFRKLCCSLWGKRWFRCNRLKMLCFISVVCSGSAVPMLTQCYPNAAPIRSQSVPNLFPICAAAAAPPLWWMFFNHHYNHLADWLLGNTYVHVFTCTRVHMFTCSLDHLMACLKCFGMNVG